MLGLSTTHIALLIAGTGFGLALGWILRNSRSKSEKNAINAGWQEQLEAQRNEHERLLAQNKSLMEQNSQYQASNRDSKMRASELSGALKEAFERRDELQRQLKDIRSNLEIAVEERKQLQADISSRGSQDDTTSPALQRRDEKIRKLSLDLGRWQERVPPLIEKFRVRNEDAIRLEKELQDARERIESLQSMVGSDQTRVDPVDQDTLMNSLDASNDSDEGMDGDRGEEESAAALEPDAPARETGNEQDELLAPEEFESLIEDDAAEIEVLVAGDYFRDDLKMIKGIGPAIEKTLIEMGICRFDQIAGMGEYEIDRIAHKLKGFRSRIYREDWIGQARNLLDQKQNFQA